MVVLLEHDSLAVFEQRFIKLHLPRGQRRRVVAGLEFEQRVLAAEVVDPQVSLDGEAQYRGGHGLVVVVHLADVPQ